jgi:hypothetical protein
VPDPARLATQYESLRARALGEAVSGPPAHGLAVLLRSGLAAWLSAMQRHHPEPERHEQLAMWHDDGPPVRSSAGDSMAMTIVILASMVLATQQE